MQNNGKTIMESQHLNYFAWSGAKFQEKDFMTSVLFKASTLDFQIDMQTYIKCQLSLYYEEAEDGTCKLNALDPAEREEYILYIYTLFANDCHHLSNFEHATIMLEEFIQQNLNSVNSYASDEQSDMYGKNNKELNKKSQKKKRRRRAEWEVANSSAPFILDHAKVDPMEEEFMQRNKLFHQTI